MNKVNRIKNFRTLVICIIFILATLVALGRIFYLQVMQNDYYTRLAYENQTRERVISAKRGTIYDRNYNVLAQSASMVSVAINPQAIRSLENEGNEIVEKDEGSAFKNAIKSVLNGIKSIFGGNKEESQKDVEPVVQTDVKEELIKGLAEILGMEYDKVTEYVNKNSNYVVLARKVEKEVGDKVLALLTKLDIRSGVSVDEDNKRFYPNGTLASQVLGFTGSENQGLYGIEVSLEEYLKGTTGRILYTTDAIEREVPNTSEDYFPAEDGASVVLTIDENIQYIAEKYLKEAISAYKIENGGCVIVMDPRNGEILAMASMPDYDPNNPFVRPEDITEEEWDALAQTEQSAALMRRWSSMAVNASYEPGSTFKAITASIGLEIGKITPESPVVCSPVKLSGYTISCWSSEPHGAEDFRHGVYNSCNPVFVNLSLQIGLKTFYEYVRAFGFYEKTGIDLPGEGNSVIHQNPTELNMATASFGQRFNITPLQLIRAYAAIANGGYLVQPQLVKAVVDADGNIVEKSQVEYLRQVISTETSETMRNILQGVVTEGSGGNAYVQGYRVAGKTGTSETLEEGHYIASFSSFAPADNPVINVLVVLDNPQGESYFGSKIAAPTAGKIAEATLEYLGVERVYSESDVVQMGKEVYIPSVTEKTLSEAKTALKQIGLNYKIIGSDDDTKQVVKQTPAGYTSINSGSIVILYTEESETDTMVTVPDLKNKTIAEATNALHNIGLNISISGRGYAETQSVEANTEAVIGSSVEVGFSIGVTD